MLGSLHFRRVLILAAILFFGFGAAVAVPTWVKAHGRGVRTGIHNASDLGPLSFQDGQPGNLNDLYTIHATSGFTVHYVAKTGDGSDPSLGWSTAYTRVQDALGAALSGDEIWVAAGVYTPGETVSDSFNLVPGVSIYGGFDILDTQLSDRDLLANVTVLSGDIGGDDITDPNGVVTDTGNITGTNSFHVIWADGASGIPITGTTTLDGFTITAGNADSSVDPDNDGGGFYCDGSQSGGYCSPSLSNLIFSGNLAKDSGGAMYNYAVVGGISSPYLSNVNFTGNKANSGGAMYNFGSISGNSSPTLDNVVLSSNVANSGGAIFNDGSYSGTSSPVLKQVQFKGNSAHTFGGAMYNLGFGSSGESSPMLINVLFSGNFSDQLGGAMFNQGDSSGTSSPTLINVTMSGNWADDPGGAMYNEGIRNGTSTPQVMNSVLWDNHDPIGLTGIKNLTATVTLTRSLVHHSGASGGGWISDTSLIDGGGNIDQDPLFNSPANSINAPTTEGDLRLASGSPAIDKGDNGLSGLLPGDLDGNPRTLDGDGDGTATVDMGAYEAPIHYKLQVSTSGSGSGVVTSTPAWINCGNVCDVTLPESSQITLTAVTGTGSQFDGWSECGGTGDCKMTVDGPKNVSASFSLIQYELTVSLIGAGSGTVTSQPSGIDCGNDCSKDYNYNQQVSLTAQADPGSTFTGWSGVCSGTGTCEVSMTAARSVGAEFSLGYGYSIFLPLGIQ